MIKPRKKLSSLVSPSPAPFSLVPPCCLSHVPPLLPILLSFIHACRYTNIVMKICASAANQRESQQPVPGML